MVIDVSAKFGQDGLATQATFRYVQEAADYLGV